MKKISFKIFLILNCITYGFIALYIALNYLFLEKYQFHVKKKNIVVIAEKFDKIRSENFPLEKFEKLKETAKKDGIFIDIIKKKKGNKNKIEKEKVHMHNFFSYKKFSKKKLERNLWDELENRNEFIDIIRTRDNIERILYAKRLNKNEIVTFATYVSPIVDVIMSTLKFFIFIIIFTIPINLYIAYLVSIKFGKPIESELLELNAQLKDELDKEKKSEQFRKNFIANITHELKTPVAIISGYSEAILDGIIKSEEIPDICENINSEASNMTALIQELLFYSKMESGYVPINKTEIDLKKLIDSLLKRYSMDIKLNKINLKLEIENVKIYSDEKLLKRAINNILTNALTYVNEEKDISISLNENELILKNSCNISENINLDDFFKPFSKTNDKKNKKFGGTGLGLSIVSEILKKLNLKYKFYYEENNHMIAFKILLKGENF